MSVEGALRVRLTLRDGRIARVTLQSTRPDVAATLLQQRTPRELTAAVPRLFSVCSASQSVACNLALAGAAGPPPDAAALLRASAEVAAEIVREFSRRALLDAPRRIGENPGGGAIQAARMAMRWTEHDSEAAAAIAMAAFGMTCTTWLALDTPAALATWIGAGTTATARELQHSADSLAAGAAADLMPATDGHAHIAEWLPTPDSESESSFAQHPHWRGRPAETGALARQQADPLVAALVRQDAARVLARHVARLRELARLLCAAPPPLAGVLDTPLGVGVAWVENARGLLVHQVHLADGRAQSYRIVAPTDWNFHPAGAVPLALCGTPVANKDDACLRAEQLTNSLDPCVECRVECVDA